MLKGRIINVFTTEETIKPYEGTVVNDAEHEHVIILECNVEEGSKQKVLFVIPWGMVRYPIELEVSVKLTS